MSDLTEALDRILNWLQRQRLEHPQATEDWWISSPEEENNPPFVKPALSSAKIAEITKDVQRDFPPEVYQLYQWRNGSYYGNSMFDFEQIKLLLCFRFNFLHNYINLFFRLNMTR